VWGLNISKVIENIIGVPVFSKAMKAKVPLGQPIYES